MSLSEPYPSFAGALPNYDPSQLNNQGFGQRHHGETRRGARQYHNYNVRFDANCLRASR